MLPATFIWKIQHLAGARFGKFQILPATLARFKILTEDLENSRSCGQDLENNKIWKMLNSDCKNGKFKTMIVRCGKFQDPSRKLH